MPLDYTKWSHSILSHLPWGKHYCQDVGQQVNHWFSFQWGSSAASRRAAVAFIISDDNGRHQRLLQRGLLLNLGQDIGSTNREVRFIVRANRHNASNLEQQFVQMVPRGWYLRLLQCLDQTGDRIASRIARTFSPIV